MASLDSYLGRKYQLESSENFDNFMTTLGVSFLNRKLGNAVSPILDLSRYDDQYVMTFTSTFKTHIIKFKLGEEVEYEAADGRKVKSTFTASGPILYEEQIDTKGKKSNYTRTFSKAEVKMDMTVDDVTANRVYKSLLE